MNHLIHEFQNNQRAKGIRPLTVREYKFRLQYLFRYLNQKGITDIKEINKQILIGYQEYLFHEYRTKEGNRLSPNTQSGLIGVLSPFFAYLTETDQIMYNPATSLNKPRVPNKIPRDILTEKEIKLLLSLPDVTTSEGYRDKVLLSLLYGTGIRASEARNIKLNDLDLTSRELFVKDGKGGKDRIIPLTRSCTKLIEVYLTQQRKELMGGIVSDFLFVGVKAVRFHKEKICKIVRKYVGLAKFKKKITTHSLRHTCASHLCKKGANIRMIQQLLGHVSLNTTQKYTRVDITDLRATIDRYHPNGGLT